MATPPPRTAWSIRCPAPLLPSFPRLLFRETIRSAVRAIPTMCLARCTHQLLTARMALLLLPVFGEIDIERGAVGVGAGARIGAHEEEGHLLIYAVVFRDWGFWGAGSGRVHVLDEVLVVGGLGPGGGGVGSVGLFFGFDDAAVGPEEEGAVGEGCGGADYGAAYGGYVECVGAGGEEVVCD